MSALRRRQLRKIIESEIKQLSQKDANLSRDDLVAIINEEAEKLANEGFWKGAGAAALRYLPGGGAALDYSRSQGFSRMEARLDAIEARLDALESGGGSI